MSKKKTQAEFEKEVYTLAGEEYTIIGQYTSSKEKIKIKHNTCGCTWDVVPTSFLYSNSRCPKCQHRSYKKTTEEFKQEVFDKCLK